MSDFHPDRNATVPPQAGQTAPAQMTADEGLAPVIAGAHARGVADMLDLLGIPGVFLDGSGEVLFQSRAARTLLARGALQLRMSHLVAEHGGDNQALAAFVADAIGGRPSAGALRLEHAAVLLRQLPRTEAAKLPGQMVRAVIVMANEADARQTTLIGAFG